MINNVVLIGRLTRDFDLRYTQNGTAIGNFTLAVNRNFTGNDGNREADFINCVIWRKPAEILANSVKKGTLLGIVGRLQTRSYENANGQRVFVTEVVCEQFQFLEKKAEQDNTGYSKVHNSQVQSNNQGLDNARSSIDISDDDLPF